MDRTTLLANSGNRTNDQGRRERVPLVATYHPALNSLGKVARKLHPMLTNSEEHREVFPEPPLIAFIYIYKLMKWCIEYDIINVAG